MLGAAVFGGGDASSVRRKAPVPAARRFVNLRHLAERAGDGVKRRKNVFLGLSLSNKTDVGGRTRTLEINEVGSFQHKLRRTSLNGSTHQAQDLRFLLTLCPPSTADKFQIQRLQVQDLRSVGIQARNRLLLWTGNQHFCRAFINALPENVIDVSGVSSVGSEEHGRIVGHPIEGEVIGIVKSEAAGRAEARALSRKFRHVDIQLRLEAAKHKFLAIRSNARLVYVVVGIGDPERRAAGATSV